MEFHRGQQNGVAVSRRTVTTYWVGLLLGIALNGSVIVCAQDVTGPGQSVDLEVLEDFQNPDEKGFPLGWEGQRSTVTAHEAYTIQQEEGISFLSAKSANQRVYTKQIKWDPKKYPVLTWRWRITSVPDNPEFIAAIYPSLDVDLLFIPVNTKYVWSATLPVGTVKEGGMFSSTEIVIRSGTQPVGEWIEERVNVYEDFLKIHNHEPATHAWGISLLGGAGVEVDFGLIQARTE